jgi:SAM-dependent methyltransferase
MLLYDNEEFFAAYAQMPRSKDGLKAAGEWHQFQPLFPNLQGKTVLDLGCGYGWHCKYAAQMGAYSVLGIDCSSRMIEKSILDNADERIQYRVCGLEDFDYPADAYDFVISNLVLHYVEDLEGIYQKVYRTLKKDGCFLFNIEHPVFTAGVGQEWIYDENGRPLYWPVENYYYPGQRETVFLGKKVLKQHHTLTQIINPLLKIGFRLEALEEAMPSSEMMHIPGMADEMRRPMMLLVKVAK